MELHDLIISLQQFFQKYQLEETEKFSYLEDFCYQNQFISSSIPYQITSLLILIANYSEIDTLFDESEMFFLKKKGRLTSKNFRFVDNALKLCHLAGQIYDELSELEIQHPVLEKEYWKSKMCLALEDYFAALYDLYTSVEENKGNVILDYMQQIDDETLNIYEPYYEEIITPKLIQAIQEENMKKFLEILSHYVHFKVCLESGLSLPVPGKEDMQSKGPLVCSKIDEYIAKNFSQKEMRSFLSWNFFQEEKQNFQELKTTLEILKNRSLAQKSFYYYYLQANMEVEEYLEKCKKM